MAEMWNHVTVRDGRIGRVGGAGHPEGGEVLMEFDSDQFFDIGSIITLADDTDVEVIGVEKSRQWAEPEDPSQLRSEQVLKVGSFGGPRP